MSCMQTGQAGLSQTACRLLCIFPQQAHMPYLPGLLSGSLVGCVFSSRAILMVLLFRVFVVFETKNRCVCGDLISHLISDAQT